MDPLERIKKQVTENPIILYMKGTPDFPQCGFSARTVQAIKSCGVEFAYVNIFEDEEVYRALPKFANWPTFPQLYVKGQLIGGCDITLDLQQSGELQKMLKEAAGTADSSTCTLPASNGASTYSCSPSLRTRRAGECSTTRTTCPSRNPNAVN